MNYSKHIINMNRRKFVKNSSLILGSGLLLSNSYSSTIAANVDINFVDTIPENWTEPAINLFFQEFIVKTKNIDISKKLDIIVESGLDKNKLTKLTKEPIKKELTESTGFNSFNFTVDLTGYNNDSGINITNNLLENNTSFDVFIRIKLIHPDATNIISTEKFSINVVPPQVKYLDFTTFSPSPPNNYNIDAGYFESSIVSTDYSGRNAIKHQHDGKNNPDGFVGTSKIVDLTNLNTMHYTTKIEKNTGRYDGLQIRIDGDKILGLRDSTHDWTKRQQDISIYTGEVPLDIGHRITGSNYKNVVSQVTDIYFE